MWAIEPRTVDAGMTVSTLRGGRAVERRSGVLKPIFWIVDRHIPNQVNGIAGASRLDAVGRALSRFGVGGDNVQVARNTGVDGHARTAVFVGEPDLFAPALLQVNSRCRHSVQGHPYLDLTRHVPCATIGCLAGIGCVAIRRICVQNIGRRVPAGCIQSAVGTARQGDKQPYTGWP